MARRRWRHCGEVVRMMSRVSGNRYLLHRIIDSLRPLWTIKTDFNLIIFHFEIRWKLSIIRCYTYYIWPRIGSNPADINRYRGHTRKYPINYLRRWHPWCLLRGRCLSVTLGRAMTPCKSTQYCYTQAKRSPNT